MASAQKSFRKSALFANKMRFAKRAPKSGPAVALQRRQNRQDLLFFGQKLLGGYTRGSIRGGY